MIIGIITTIATIIIAPFTFWLLGHTIYSKSKLKKFPTQINDGIGDTIFLPIFNGILIEAIISSSHTYKPIVLIISMITSIILTSAYVYYQKNISTNLDWSKPRQGKLNFGGWYHAGYMLIQIILTTYGIITFYNNYLLWGMIGGYLISTIIQFLKEGHI